jgi:predicted lipoprotein with Yx(FWY)xxD motif
MRTATLAVALLAAVVLALPAPSTAGTPGARSTLTVEGSRFGRILFDGRGFVLYAFTADARGRSVCRGACAAAWPPFLVSHAPRAGSGVSPALLGTTRRRDGSLQATYAGRPLYFYVGDRRPGQVLCQDVEEFGGTWLVVGPTGRLVR